MKERKLWRIIIPVIVFAILLLPAVYLNTPYGYLPGLFVAFALLLSWICLWQINKKLEADSDLGETEQSCVRGGSVSAGLMITNRSRIMSARTVVTVFISDPFGGPESTNRMYFTLAPRERTDFGIDIDMPHVGVYRAGVRDVEIWDYFGWFSMKAPLTKEFEVFVRPRIRTMDEIGDAELILAESRQETRITVLGGMDYVGVREYERGDSMKQIHWKLSARAQEYMTKLQESSRETEYAVILDLAGEREEDTEVRKDIQDALIETSLSILDAVSKHHTNYALYYCNRMREIRRVRPRGRDDDLMLVKDFMPLTAEPDSNFPDAQRILEEEGSRAGRSTNVVVVTSRVTDGLLQALLRVRAQRRQTELYHIVPAGLNSREIETIRARLHELEEAGVGHSLVYTTDAGGEVA